MRLTATWSVLLLLVGLASPSAAELPPLVEAAFASAAVSTGGWAYTRSSVENGVTTVERFDPATAADGWTLITIGGKAPSKKQIKKYAERSSTRETRDHPGEVDFHDIVDIDSVELVADSATSASYRFKPAPNDPDDEAADDDDFPAELVGALVIDKTGPFVEFLELENTEPFSAATGVKVNKMRVRMEFAVDDHGRTVLRKLSQSVEGKLFGLKRINQATTTTYSEFGAE